jgi:hypothetical protein
MIGEYQMNNNASVELKRVASRLEQKGKPQSKVLFKLAQEIGQMENLYNNGSFDPSQDVQEPQVNPEETQVSPDMSQQLGGSQDVQPLADVDVGGDKPPIESFVRLNNPGTPSNYDTHNCSVVFRAPKGTQESDMMNYIMGIGKELGVEVFAFDWEKQEPKENKVK